MQADRARDVFNVLLEQDGHVFDDDERCKTMNPNAYITRTYLIRCSRPIGHSGPHRAYCEHRIGLEYEEWHD